MALATVGLQSRLGGMPSASGRSTRSGFARPSSNGFQGQDLQRTALASPAPQLERQNLLDAPSGSNPGITTGAVTSYGITDQGVTSATPVVAGTAAGPFNAFTFNATVDADANFLTVWLLTNSTTATGVTFDGVAMYQIGTVVANGIRAEAWGLANPHTGTHSVVASGVTGGAGNGAWAFKNVGSAPGAGSGVGSTFTGTAGPVTTNAITGANRGMIVGGTAASGGDPSMTGGTEAYSDNGGETVADIAATGSAQTTTWALGGGTPNVSIMLVALPPGGAVTDSVGATKIPARVVTDNGVVSQSDTLVKTVARPVADSGVTQSIVLDVVPMTVSNDFDVGQTSGTTITPGNSGSSTDQAFDAVAGAPTYDSAHFKQGALSGSMPTGAARRVGWTGATLGAQQVRWGRAYFYFAGWPAGAVRIADGDGDVTTDLFRIQATSTGHFQVNINGGTNVSGAIAIPTGQWCRLEWLFQVLGGVATVTLRTYTAADGVLTMPPTEELTQTGACSDTFVLADTAGPASTFGNNIWIDAYAATNQGWLGPIPYTRRNDFETGSSGANITAGNSGGPTEDAFGNVTGTPQYSTTHALSGSQSMLGSASSDDHVSWAASATDLYARGYFFIGGAPGATARFASADTDGTSQGFYLQINTAGKLIISFNGVNPVTFTNAVNLGPPWTRIEWRMQLNPQTQAATLTVRLYQTGSSPIASFTEEKSTSGTLAGTPLDTSILQVNLGAGAASTRQTWYDDFALSIAGWIGPSGATNQAPTDTGATIGDAIGLTTRRPITDTGYTGPDTLLATKTLTRSITDTGKSGTDTLATTRLRAITDSGVVSFSDSVTATRVGGTTRNVTDTGVTQTDAVARLVIRPLADAGTTITDSLTRTRTVPRSPTDTGTTITDTLLKQVVKIIADTGTSLTDSVARVAVRGPTDTGSAITDTLIRTVIRTLADTGVSQSDTAGRVFSRTITDSGLQAGGTAIGTPYAVGTGSDATTASATVALTTTAAINPGDSLFLCIAVRTGTPVATTASFSGIGAPSEIQSHQHATQTLGVIIARFYLPSGLSSGTTITATLDQTSNRRMIAGVGVPGVANQAVDQVASADGTSGNPATAAPQSNPNAFALSVWSIATNDGTSPVNPGSGWTTLANVWAGSATWGLEYSEYQVLTTQTTVTATKSATGGQSGTTEIVAVWDAVAAGMTDSVVATKSSGSTSTTRNITDTGVSESDAVATLRLRAVTDTGSSVIDSTASSRQRAVADTGASVTDTVATPRSRPVIDTGTTVADSVAVSRQRTLADTGASIADSLAPRAVVRALTSTGTTITDTVGRARPVTITDTGLVQSDALVKAVTKLVTDTGLAQSDSVLVSRGPTRLIADTGESQTDTVTLSHPKVLADTGAAITDSVAATTIRPRTVTDTGETQTDVVRKVVAKPVTDTGTTISDAVGRIVIRGLADDGVGYTFTDPFTRSVASGSLGGSWVNTTVSTLWSVDGSEGVIGPFPGSSALTRNSELATGQNDGQTAKARMRWDQVPVGGSPAHGLLLRAESSTGPNNSVRVRAIVNTSGGTNLTISTLVAAAATTLYNAVASVQPVATQWHWIKGEYAGGRVRAKIWLDGTPEPAAWEADVADTSNVPPNSYVGITFQVIGTETDTTTFQFDDYSWRVFDSLAVSRQPTLTDTGVTQSDTLTRLIVRTIADTGLVQSDSVATAAGGHISVTDTGLSQSDVVRRLLVHGLTDTGTAMSDTVAATTTRPRAVTDTGEVQTDSLQTARIRGITDTGEAQSDSVTRQRVVPRALTDIGSAITDTLARALSRAITDTGEAQSDSVTTAAGGHVNVSDTGTSMSDLIRRTIQHGPADSGVTQTDAVLATRAYSRAVSDNGVVGFSDTVAVTRLRARGVTDVGASVTDTISLTVVRKLTDTGLAQSDTVVRTRIVPRNVTDNGVVSFADSVVRTITRVRGVTDTVTISDTVATTRLFQRPLTDAGVSQSDSVTTAAGGHVNITDTGVAESDSVRRVIVRPLADAGTTITDSISLVRVRSISVTDVGEVQTDTLGARQIQRHPTDQGASITDSVGRAVQRAVTDTGTALSDAVVGARGHPVIDTGATISDSVARLKTALRPPTDQGASITDSLRRVRAVGPADVGAAITDVVVRHLAATRPLADTGAVILDLVATSSAGKAGVSDSMPESDHLGALRIVRVIRDTGLVQSDVVHLLVALHVQLVDQGAHITDYVMITRRVLTGVSGPTGQPTLGDGTSSGTIIAVNGRAGPDSHTTQPIVYAHTD